MPSLDEFSLIERFFAPLAAGYPGAFRLKDDAALLAPADGRQWVVTMDCIVAGTHFFADDPADQIAQKLLRVNLSDLAAKGAEPQAVMLAASFPRATTTDWLQLFAQGLAVDCQTYGLSLIGGDTVATDGPLTLTVTAFGTVPVGQMIRRAGAVPGDRLWVSGTIGDSVLGLAIAQADSVPGVSVQDRDWLLDRYRRPQPRTRLGLRLRNLAHAGLDISDGLLGDLAHLCRESGVGARIEAALLPLSAAAQSAVDAGWPGGRLRLASGGDDYELLFAVADQQTAEVKRAAADLGLRLTPIGRIIEGEAVLWRDMEGQDTRPVRSSYRHFHDEAE